MSMSVRTGVYSKSKKDIKQIVLNVSPILELGDPGIPAMQSQRQAPLGCFGILLE